LNNTKIKENPEFLEIKNVDNSNKNFDFFEKNGEIAALMTKKRILSDLRPKKLEATGYKNQINNEIGDILKKQDELFRRIQETDHRRKKTKENRKKFEDLYENRMKNFFSQAEIIDLKRKILDLKEGEKKEVKTNENYVNYAESFVYQSIF